MKVAWKEITFQPKKFILIELLIVLMMFMVIFLSGLTNGLGRTVSAQIDNFGDVHYTVTKDAEGVLTFSNPTYDQVIDLKSLNIKDAGELIIQRSTIFPEDEASTLDITYFATNDSSLLKPKLTSGNALETRKRQIILDDAFEAKGVALGDSIKDKATKMTFEVVGFAKDAKYGHSSVAFISKESYQDMRQKIDPHYEWKPQALITNKPIAKSDLPKDMQTFNKKEIIEKIPGYMAEHTTLTMITWVLLLASSAILGVFFYIMTLQKLKHFGVLKAIGMPMKNISAIQISQISILALLGVGIGLAFAMLLAIFLPKSMPFYMTSQANAVVSISFVLIAVICGSLSLFKIKQVDPIEVIGGNGE